MATNRKATPSKSSSHSKSSGGAKLASTARPTAKPQLTTVGAPRPASPAPSAPSAYTAAASSKVVRLTSEATQDLFANSTKEAKKAQEQAFEFGRDSAEQFSRAAETAARSSQEAVAQARETFEAAIESSNSIADMIKEFSTEFVNGTNEAFTDNVELSKEFFACKTISDLYDLHARFTRTNMDHGFTQVGRISNLFFKYAAEASEPVTRRISEATERFAKNYSA